MMTDKAKLEWIHFAIQEAMNDNPGELEQAIGLVEDLREKASGSFSNAAEQQRRDEKHGLYPEKQDDAN